MAPLVSILAENAVAVVFSREIDLANHRRVIAFLRLAEENAFPGLRALAPAYASLTVFFDPFALKPLHSTRAPAAQQVQEWLLRLLELPYEEETETGELIEIPVHYDGMDLCEVAERLNMPEAELVRLHTGVEYTVFMTGFLPGFPYLGILPPELQLPRRSKPRLLVPAGSVAIAGAQTGVYPQDSPGGWHILGRTELKLFDVSKTPPALLKAGMKVRFKAV